MAYALKTTGQALDVAFCLLVDDDGTTIVDLKGSVFTRHANVSIGTKAWKGAARPYFQTKGSGSTTAQGLEWAPGNMVPFPTGGSSSVAVFCAMAGINDAGNFPSFAAIGRPSGNHTANGLYLSSNKARFRQGSSGSAMVTGASDLPVGGTSFSVGVNYRNNAANGGEIFVGLESGALASDGVESVGNYGNADTVLAAIGGSNGFGWLGANFHVVVGFKSARTLAQMQALHNDWFGELIDAGAGSPLVAPNVRSTQGITQTAATVRWFDLSSGETGFDVELETPSGAGNWTPASNSPAAANATQLIVTGLSPSTQYRPRVRAAGSPSPSDWSVGDAFTTASALTKKLKVKIDKSAQGATGVTGVVWAAPPPGENAGPEIGEFSGATFESALEDDKAVLKVPVSAFGGSALTTSDTPVALVRNTDHTSGIVPCTVIEE